MSTRVPVLHLNPDHAAFRRHADLERTHNRDVGVHSPDKTSNTSKIPQNIECDVDAP